MNTENHKTLTDKLRIIIIELQKFKKVIEECENNELFLWLYFLKNAQEC